VVDTVKEKFGLLGVLIHPSPHIWQGLGGLFTSVQAKKGDLAGEIITSYRAQEGAMTTPGVSIYGIVHKTIMSYVHRARRRVRPNRLEEQTQRHTLLS
jgi:hypothetical protein